MRQVRTRGKDVHFSSCRPEADPDGTVDRNTRSLTARAVGRRYRRSFSALLGRSDLDHCGATRSAIAGTRCQKNKHAPLPAFSLAPSGALQLDGWLTGLWRILLFAPLTGPEPAACMHPHPVAVGRGDCLLGPVCGSATDSRPKGTKDWTSPAQRACIREASRGHS